MMTSGKVDLLFFRLARGGAETGVEYIGTEPVQAIGTNPLPDIYPANRSKRRIYLDHAATTPMMPQACDAVIAGMQSWANPSSPHAQGRAARAALEDARARIKAALGWTGQILLTSGASEALAIGMGRAKVDRRIVSAVEHESGFRAAPGAQLLPMTGGSADRDVLADLLAQPGRALVAIQHLNSETGGMQPVSDYAAQVREAGGVILSDCAQSAGKFALPDADMIVVSAHKFGGPPGIGALLIRDLGLLEPSGGQEFGYRGGTENLPGAMGFAAALEARDVGADGTAGWVRDLAQPVAELTARVTQAGGALLTSGTVQGGTILAITMPRLKSAAQLIRFDAQGIAVSAGSACSSGTLKTSRTLMALGVDDDTAARTIRVSFGWNTTPDDIRAFEAAWLDMAQGAK